MVLIWERVFFDGIGLKENPKDSVTHIIIINSMKSFSFNLLCEDSNHYLHILFQSYDLINN